MIYEIIRYEVYKKGKSKPIPYVKKTADLVAERKLLEEKHHCFRKTITGIQKVGEIFFTYRILEL